MGVAALFVRRPVMTLLVMLAILVAGLLSYKRLPVSDLPNIDLPVIQVSVSYPGTSPETMANSVTAPLERQFMTINGIQSVFSVSNTGSSTIVLQFDIDRDLDSAATDVQSAITTAQPLLPSDLPQNPTYRKINPTAAPILYLALTAPNMSQGDLYDYANTFIGQRLSAVDGVAQVITFGSPYAVRIQLDPEKLAAKEIGIDQVANHVALQNVDLPLGSLSGPKVSFTINTDGQLMDAAGYSEIIVKNEKGDLVKIKDLGRVLDSVEDDKYFMRYLSDEHNEPCIILGVQRLANRNAVRIIDHINQILDELVPQLPNTLKIHRIYDKSASIREAVADVEMTLVLAFILVVAIIYFSLGKWLNTLIPTLVLPLAIFGTFACMLVLGFSIDIFSLLALTLSIGFLVDDAIVVLENNVRHVEKGEDPIEAAIHGTEEIGLTIVSITLCLMAGFFPLVFMGGVIGRLFHEFGVTINIAILFSGFLAVTFTPMLCSRFVRPYAKGRKQPRMEIFAASFTEKSKQLYTPCLKWALQHRFVMLGIGSACIAFSLVLFRLIPMDFFPPDDIGFIQGFTVARDGTSPYLMEQYHEKIGKIALENPNIESALSISGSPTYNEGKFFFRLHPIHERVSLPQVVRQLSAEFHKMPGVNVYLSPLPLVNFAQGTTVQALYQYSISGFDRKKLYAAVPPLLQKMKEDPHFSQVSSDLKLKQPEWSFEIDRDKASYYNISAAQIENFFGYAYSGNKISQINGDINQYDVLIETLPRFYESPAVLPNLYVRSFTNALVPLAEILKPSETIGPLSVTHINGFPSVNISFNPGSDLPLGTVLEKLRSLSQEILPNDVHGKVIGTAEIFEKSFANLVLLLLLTFFIIYAILGILYESFIHPITVMSSLPPTVFGGLLTLYITGQPLSIYSFVGLILLIGMVLKNGIMMVDFANVAVHQEKKTAYDAIIEACLIRFRPILMTTLSSGIGVVPIALGVGGGMAINRIPLGLCIIGGLFVSQILTLLLTPVIYLLFEEIQEKILKKWATRPKGEDGISGTPL